MTATLPALLGIAVVALALFVTWRLRRDEPGVVAAPPRQTRDGDVDTLERAAVDPEAVLSPDALVAIAGTTLAGLDGIELSRFETFPFECALPRLARGVIQFPADEPGTNSLAAWDPGDGVEVAVCANGLQIGRFVLVGPAVDDPVTMPPSIHGDVVGIAERLGAALTARVALDPNVPLPRGGATWRTSCSSPS